MQYLWTGMAPKYGEWSDADLQYNWHCTIGFLILFFRKEYIFFSNVYISVNTIFEGCYLFFGWEIGHPLSTCVTEGMEGFNRNVYRCIQGEEVSRLMCTYALTDNYSFQVFVLRCLLLTSIKKGVLLYIFESPQKTGIGFS